MNFTVHLALFDANYAPYYTAPVDFVDHEDTFEDLEEVINALEEIEDFYSHDGLEAQVIGITDEENGYQELEEARFTVELAKSF